MNLHWLRATFERDLQLLRRELEAYPDEAGLWVLPAGITNSAGTLTLHLCGNLRHFVGAKLGGTGYVRDRPAEFSLRNVPRAELVAGIDAARRDVGDTLTRLTAADLDREFPEPVGGVRLNTGDFLMHLLAHALYHIGQVDYHRRVVTGSAASLDPVKPAHLASARPAE